MTRFYNYNDLNPIWVLCNRDKFPQTSVLIDKRYDVMEQGEPNDEETLKVLAKLDRQIYSTWCAETANNLYTEEEYPLTYLQIQKIFPEIQKHTKKLKHWHKDQGI